MANKEHLSIFKKGVEAWNQWRRMMDLYSSSNSRQGPLLIPKDIKRSLKKDLPQPDLSGVDLSGGHFEGINLSSTNLSRANLMDANLRRANLAWAFLAGANCSGADFRGAMLQETDLSDANFTMANLGVAFLAKDGEAASPDTPSSDVFTRRLNEMFKESLQNHPSPRTDMRTDLSKAFLHKTNFRGANLSYSVCQGADFTNSNLAEARLTNTDLTEADLSGACLWETQRSGWSIFNIVCKSIYWDLTRKEATIYQPGEFERYFSEKIRIRIKYTDGIDPLEIVTLPALIQHLEALHPNCSLRFESIQDGPGGAVVTVVIDKVDNASSAGQVEQLKRAIESEWEQKIQRFRLVLKKKDDEINQLEGKVEAVQWAFKKLLKKWPSNKPPKYIIKGDVEMGDTTYNIGQAGAVGPNAHAHDINFNQVGGLIEKSMDLTQLAGELLKLRQEMKKEAIAPEHDIAISEVAKAEQAAKEKDASKMAEYLQSSGKWALDVATKVGIALASEALKHSMGMK